MSKGPDFVDANARRHEQRVGEPWWKVCVQVDVEKLRIQLTVEQVRMSGGLSNGDKTLLKSKINEIQRRRWKSWARIERGYG